MSMIEDYFKNPDAYEFETRDYDARDYSHNKELNDLLNLRANWGWFLFGSVVPKFDGVTCGYTATFIRRKDWQKATTKI